MDLPPRMVFKHGAYYWTPRIKGRQVMQHLGIEYQVALKTYHEREGKMRVRDLLPEPQGNWK